MNELQNGARLCLVEDDPIMGESLIHRFSLEGIACDWFRNAEAALRAIASADYAAVVSDIRLPDRNGEELFGAMLREGLTPPTLFITGYSSVEQAVRLLKMGAKDYITKPFDLEELLAKLLSVCPRLGGEAARREPALGVSPAMRGIEALLARLGRHSASVLISGESGVGKEHAARFLHQHAGPDGARPFVPFNCAAVPETLIESELFGHVKGAFTTAVRAHRGVFERAHGGTLLLDEIGEMSPAMQVKLLRTIQERVVQRVGGEELIPVDVRLVCLTNRDLKAMVQEGSFREDLYFRINVVNVHVPPLRERRDDILWFARRFVDEYSRANGVRRHLLALAEQYLVQQPWPGNIRELRHFVERACIFAEHEFIGPKELEACGTGTARAYDGDILPSDLKSYLMECERQYLVEKLEVHDWHIIETAQMLGISRKNLWEKMLKHGIRIQPRKEPV